MTAPLVFLDTETTALHSGRKAWEIGMIRRDALGTRSLSFFIGNLDLGNADPASLAVGRFYQRHPQYKNKPLSDFAVRVTTATLGGPVEWVSEGQAARQVERWTRGAHLVGAVPSFDAETLERMLRRHGHIAAWHYHLIDVHSLALGYLHGRRAESIPGQLERHGITGRDMTTAVQAFRDRARTPTAGIALGADALRVLSVLADLPDPAAEPTVPWSSVDLSHACGVQPPADDDRHTAMGDARWVMRWYDAITGHREPVVAAVA